VRRCLAAKPSRRPHADEPGRWVAIARWRSPIGLLRRSCLALLLSLALMGACVRAWLPRLALFRRRIRATYGAFRLLLLLARWPTLTHPDRPSIPAAGSTATARTEENWGARNRWSPTPTGNRASESFPRLVHVLVSSSRD
jgi:hypothetical protein